MKKNKTLTYILIAGAVLIVFGIVGKKSGWFGKGPVQKVSVEEVTNKTILETITAYGRIQPETEVEISPDVSGEIVELGVQEGNRVQKGDLLVKIKQDYYLSSRDRFNAALNTAKAQLANSKAALSQAEAQFQQQKSAYQRNKQLHDQGVLSDADYENATAQFEVSESQTEAARQQVAAAGFSVKSAEASLKEAEENLRKTIIYAPIDGIIYGLRVEEGERVVGTGQMAGTEMMRIADLNRMEVQVEVNENDIIRVSLSDTAGIDIDSYLGKKFRGVVTEIATSANTTGASLDQVTSFNVKILILPESYGVLNLSAADDHPFRPGMSATVEIETEIRKNVPAVPIQAVTTRPDTIAANPALDPTQPGELKDTGVISGELAEVVFLVEGSKVKKVKVLTGIQDKNYIEILSGLETGQMVIAAPYNAISKKLEDGDEVEIVSREELFNPSVKKK